MNALHGKFYGNILTEEGPLTVVDTDGASEAGVYILVEVLIRCIEANVVRKFFFKIKFKF